MSKTIRVGIIDDQPLFLDGVIDALKAQSDIEVLGHAASIGDAIQLIQENELDVIVVGVSLPDDRFEALDAIVSKYPAVRILVLSDSSDEERICDAIAAGLSGYLPRSTSGPELVNAVRSLDQGIGCVSPTLAGRLLMRASQGGSGMTKPRDRLKSLAPREKQIISMLAVGLSNREIGNKLDVNEGTVKYYVTSILGKLQVRNRVEAALFARSQGLVWQASDETALQFEPPIPGKPTGSEPASDRNWLHCVDLSKN
jgi:two-component system, NarL family, nitrate/nitrite response regulator NarL